MLRVVYGIRYLAPRGSLLTRLFSAGAVPFSKRFRDDYVLSVGSDLGRAHDSASRLPEVMFSEAPRGKRRQYRTASLLLANTAERIFISKGGVLCACALLHTIRAVIAKMIQLSKMPPLLGENIEAEPLEATREGCSPTSSKAPAAFFAQSRAHDRLRFSTRACEVKTSA